VAGTMSKREPTDLSAMAQQFAERSIVTKATARLIEQVLLEVHETQIAPRDKRIAHLEDICLSLGSPEHAVKRDLK
jgi:hypothetical protein